MCVPETLIHFVKCRFSQLVHRLVRHTWPWSGPGLLAALSLKAHFIWLAELLWALIQNCLLSHTCSSSTYKTFSCLVQSQCSSPSRHSPHLQRRRQRRRHAGQRHGQRQHQQTNFCIRAMIIALASAAEILVSSHTHRTYAYAQLYHRRSVFFWGVGPLLWNSTRFWKKRRRPTVKS